MLGHDAIEPVAPTAKSVWPRKKFAAHPTFPLLFDLRVNAGTAFMASFGEMRDFSARIEKGASRLRLSELAGNWSGGFLTGMVSLESAATQAMLSGELKWAGAPLSGFYRPDGKTPLSGIVKAEMSVTGSGENVTALIGSLAGAASIDIENFTIHGFDENALPRMLQATDLAVDQKPNGETLDSRRFAVIAEEATGPGHLALGNVHLDAAIAGGKVRIAPLDLATARAVLKGEVQLDLVTLALGGSGTLAFIHATDREAGLLLEIHFELDGNYDAPRIRLDRQPLTQFLTQRALEREQDRVEAMQAALMEKQALRRQLGLLKAQEEARERARIEEENRRRAELAAQEKRRAEQMSHGQGLGPVEGLDDFLKGLERGAPPDRAPQDTGKSPSIQP